MSRADHMDVAAYALGVLDQQDTERFEEHLATCWACAAELETIKGTRFMWDNYPKDLKAALKLKGWPTHQLREDFDPAIAPDLRAFDALGRQLI